MFEYVHGCLTDHSAILGINDSVDTIDGNYDFLRKSFNSHYTSHPIAYDLHDVDEVVFFGHSLGDNDYHYFQSFFRQQCKENMERKDGRDITIFTYNEKSRMEIMHTLHKMNDGQTSLLFQTTTCVFSVQRMRRKRKVRLSKVGVRIFVRKVLDLIRWTSLMEFNNNS